MPAVHKQASFCTFEMYSYSFFRVSKTEDVSNSAKKHRDLRLRALRASPSSFASTYEIEAAFSDTDWIERLMLLDREVFICAATPQDSPSTAAPSEWIGQVTFCGPMSREDFFLPLESGHPAPRTDHEEERWQILGLFTLPGYRGNGLGARLCKEALEYLRKHRPSPRTIQVRLMIKPENHITIKLYQRLGFTQTGRGTLAEALTANGDGHLLPAGTGDAKYSDRTAVIMALYMSPDKK